MLRILIWCIYSLLHFLTLSTLSFPSMVILPDALLSGFFYAIIAFFVEVIFRYTSLLSISNKTLTISFHVLFIFFSLFIFNGLYTLVNFLFFKQTFLFLVLPTIVLRVEISALIILLVFCVFNIIYSKKTFEESLQITESKIDIEIEDKKSQADFLERVLVKTSRNIVLIPIDEIIYLKSEGDYINIITSKGRYLKEQTMKYFEEHLSPKKFLRVHRSYIVNVTQIARIEKYNKQYQQVIVKNGDCIKISLNGYRKLKTEIAD